VAVSFPLAIEAFRGMQVSVECTVRAENVTQPAQNYNGVKGMLVYDTASSASGKVYVNADDVYGTFDWKDTAFNWTIHSDASQGEINLSLQDCTGTAWISDVRIRLLHTAPVRPVIDPLAPPPSRGHVAMRGFDSSSFLVAKDFNAMGSLKANNFRWQMNTTDPAILQDAAAYDAWLESRLAALDAVLPDARNNGIKMIIDLHATPGGILANGCQALFTDAAHAAHFIAVWQKIAARYKGNSAIFAYDLMNEPVQWAPTPAGLLDWRGIQIAAAKAIRAIDPDTLICFEVDGGDDPSFFTWLSPVDVPGIIYSVHMYQPHAFTHQGVDPQWGAAGSQSYPGTYNGEPFDKDKLRAYLKPVRDFQLACRVPVYAGEFSAIRWATGAAQYLKDLTDIFEEYGWDWSYHAFREYQGWDLEMQNLPYDKVYGIKATTTTDRMQVIGATLQQNQNPY